jgi:protein O-GlcNAc transferase
MSKSKTQTGTQRQQARLAYQQKNLPEAKRLFEKVIKQDRADAESWLLLGNIYGRLGKFAKAEQAFRQVLSLSPGSPGAYNNLGLALEAQAKTAASLEAFQQALRLDPGNIDTHYNLANTLVSLGRLAESLAHYESVLQAQPQHFAALINFGDVLQRQRLYSEAAAIFARAIVASPGSAEAHYNLGNALKLQGKFAKAAETYRQAIALNADYAEAWINLGNVLLEQGDVAEAIANYHQLLLRKPEMANVYSGMIFCENYLEASTPQTLYEHHRQYEQRYALAQTRLTHTPAQRCLAGQKLRIGYVSPDLHDHPVASFFEPLLQHHDPSKFETYCYSNGDKHDAVTERLQTQSQHWRDTANLSDQQLVAQIRADRIDILIDLAGHSADNRLRVFAHKPAPIQISWLGYPNTTGMTAMDYRISDWYVDPPGQESYHSESLYRLDKGFLCYRPEAESPAVTVAPASRTGHITFGSFNKLAKTTDAVLETWAAILNATPHSRLLLKNAAFKEALVRDRLIERFQQFGIAQDRLELIAWVPSKSDHMKLYEQIDIGLDTFPYNGTTTTCEAMWMGVPVISLCGNRHAARVGNSLLQQVGLQELIADSKTAYIEVARRLAGDVAQLQRLRASLRQRVMASSLADAPGFTRRMESAYHTLWQSWCENK